MPSQVYFHPTLPALIRVLGSDFSIDIQDTLTREDIGLLDTAPHKVYYVFDLSAVNVSFETLSRGVASIAHGEAYNKYHHPNIIENVMIIQSRMVELAAQNLKAPNLGGVYVKIFHTLEEALGYIEQQGASK